MLDNIITVIMLVLATYLLVHWPVMSVSVWIVFIVLIIFAKVLKHFGYLKGQVDK